MSDNFGVWMQAQALEIALKIRLCQIRGYEIL